MTLLNDLHELMARESELASELSHISRKIHAVRMALCGLSLGQEFEIEGKTYRLESVRFWDRSSDVFYLVVKRKTKQGYWSKTGTNLFPSDMENKPGWPVNKVKGEK